MDPAVTDGRHDQSQHAEDDDPDGWCVDVEDRVDRLPGEHRPGGGEAEIHDDHQHERNGGAEDSELRPAGDHLGQTEPGALRGVQRHDDATGEVPDEEPDDRPDGVGAEDHCQRSVHDRGDLHVGAEPQGELAAGRAVPLPERHDIDAAPLDARDGRPRPS
jgi:hypothetical protein